MKIKIKESMYKTNTKEDLLDSILNITNAYSDERLFSELRDLLENIKDTELKDTLAVLIDETDADNEDGEFVYAVLSSEIESYYKLKGVSI